MQSLSLSVALCMLMHSTLRQSPAKNHKIATKSNPNKIVVRYKVSRSNSGNPQPKDKRAVKLSDHILSTSVRSHNETKNSKRGNDYTAGPAAAMDPAPVPPCKQCPLLPGSQLIGDLWSRSSETKVLSSRSHADVPVTCWH